MRRSSSRRASRSAALALHRPPRPTCGCYTRNGNVSADAPMLVRSIRSAADRDTRGRNSTTSRGEFRHSKAVRLLLVTSTRVGSCRSAALASLRASLLRGHVFGAECQNRTDDLLITRQMLYQLS